MIAEYKVPVVIEKIMSNEYNFLKIIDKIIKTLHFLMIPPEKVLHSHLHTEQR